ncbi:MAG: protein phosphatase 2C domain-containing protein [Candidatus Saccharimonadales bacterium]
MKHHNLPPHNNHLPPTANARGQHPRDIETSLEPAIPYQLDGDQPLGTQDPNAPHFACGEITVTGTSDTFLIINVKNIPVQTLQERTDGSKTTYRIFETGQSSKGLVIPGDADYLVLDSRFTPGVDVGWIPVQQGDELTIGRANPTTNQRLAMSNDVSRQQCTLSYIDGVLTIQDEKSTNGTTITSTEPLTVASSEQHTSSPEQPQVFTAGSYTETKPGRSVNEDQVFHGPREIGVFDGAGGHAGSDIASAIASEQIHTALDTLTDGMSPHSIEQHLRHAFAEADQRIRDTATKEHRGQIITTGTTAFVRKDARGRDMLYVAYVGDSPAYLMNGERFEQLTLGDYSFGTEGMNDSDRKAQQDRLANVATPQDVAALSPADRLVLSKRNYVGHDMLGIGNAGAAMQFIARPFTAGDTVIVASDGVSDNLLRDKRNDNRPNLHRTLLNGIADAITPEQLTARIGHIAGNSAKATSIDALPTHKPDDISVAILSLERDTDSEAAASVIKNRPPLFAKA